MLRLLSRNISSQKEEKQRKKKEPNSYIYIIEKQEQSVTVFRHKFISPVIDRFFGCIWKINLSLPLTTGNILILRKVSRGIIWIFIKNEKSLYISVKKA